MNSLADAEARDAGDPIYAFRGRFHLPHGPDGQPLVYLCGHSLGLQPLGVRALIDQELTAWADLAVDAHFHGPTPWYTYHEVLREPGARLVGAHPDEVVFMNGLTVNLHLLLATFYRPTRDRWRILHDDPCFPSDHYALQSQARHHGLAPAEVLLPFRPDDRHLFHVEALEALLEREGGRIAVVLLPGVHFLTGQVLDVARITASAHRHGCLVGFDLAHAAGNVPLALHDWGVDFAVWCSYKYLNGGPGAVAGAFVHRRHAQNISLPRLAGWWGNDPATRFRMQLESTFVPVPSADAWQLSNPPILSLAPVRASLALFDEATVPALRQRSLRLTTYALDLLDALPPGRVEVLTPRADAERGSQLSLRLADRPREARSALQAQGIVADFREPDVLRVAFAPLYNTHRDAWQLAQALREV